MTEIRYDIPDENCYLPSPEEIAEAKRRFRAQHLEWKLTSNPPVSDYQPPVFPAPSKTKPLCH